MRQTHVLTALVMFAVTGAVTHSQSLAEARQGDLMKNLSGMMTSAAHVHDYWQKGTLSSSQPDRSLSLPTRWIARDAVDRGRSQQESLIHKVGTDAYSGTSGGYTGFDVPRSQQGAMPGDQSRQTGEYKAGSPSTEGQYGSNPSGKYLRKESSGSSSGLSGGPYGGAVYGGVPTTPSADPMIRELNRDPSIR